jgi:hypothetical protein
MTDADVTGLLETITEYIQLGDRDAALEELRGNMPLLNESEDRAMSHLLSFMDIVMGEWKLQKGSNVRYEFTLAMHALQAFVIQHMLQRTAPSAWGTWYDDPNLTEHTDGQ